MTELLLEGDACLFASPDPSYLYLSADVPLAHGRRDSYRDGRGSTQCELTIARIIVDSMRDTSP